MLFRRIITRHCIKINGNKSRDIYPFSFSALLAEEDVDMSGPLYRLRFKVFLLNYVTSDDNV